MLSQNQKFIIDCITHHNLNLLHNAVSKENLTSQNHPEYPKSKRAGKPKQTKKMATSIAAELLEKINHIKYVDSVDALTVDHKLPENVFQIVKKSMKGTYIFSYERFCTTRGIPKPDGMFELFSKYSGKSVSEVREDLITYAQNNKNLVLKVATDYFKSKHMDIRMWIILMARSSNPGDELALYLLCQLHNRHAVIYNKIKTWSTMDPNSIKPSAPLEEMCDITLMYRINGFCEAKRADKSTTEQVKTKPKKSNVATASVRPTTSKQNKRKTACISDLLNEAKQQESTESSTKEHSESINTVSAKLSTDNILPDGPRMRNTRDPTPFRRRMSERPLRNTHVNKNYSDNIDNNHLDTLKKRPKKPTHLRAQREPSHTRLIAQKILTRSQLSQNAPPGVKRKLIGTYIKEEDKKPKIESVQQREDEFYQSEIAKLQQKRKKEKDKRKWPKDAKLIHIDGSKCSQECMKTSRYHLDPTDMQQYSVNLPPNEDPRNTRPMGLTPKEKGHNQEKPTSTEQTNESIDLPTQRSEQLELCGATSENDASNEINSTPQPPNSQTDSPIHDTSQLELEGATSKDSLSDELNTNIAQSKKQYGTKRTTHESIPPTTDLPHIEKNLTPRDDELPGTTTNNEYRLDEQEAENVTMLDNLPLLDYCDDLEDFETLMNIADDDENRELVPVGGSTQTNFVKDMNRDCGINTDLEIAMDNAKFLDQHLLVPRPKSGLAKPKRSKRGNAEPIKLQTQTPGSPKGQLTLKTHGIRRLGPEDQQDKVFKCTMCTFTGYSRATVSEHFSTKHGAVYCPTCGKKCANPHALKRHEYEHSEEKAYQCKDCEQSFYFESELSSHRIKHRTTPTFTCHGCGKTFKRNSELNAHVEVHSGKLWYCDHPGCDYSNADKRLLKGHKRSHSDRLTFVCKYSDCNEKFKHTMARLRHYEKEH